MLEIHTVITFGYQIQDSAAIPRDHNWVFGDRSILMSHARILSKIMEFDRCSSVSVGD